MRVGAENEEYAELADLSAGHYGRSAYGRGGTGRGGPRSYSRAARAGGAYYSPPGTSYTIVERPSSAGAAREFGYEGAAAPRATYLGAPNNNKKRPISPEQVLRLFGSRGGGAARRSPAGSPPPPGAQRGTAGGPSVHELTTRTVTMAREAHEPGFGICVKGGKDAGVGVYISRIEEGSVAERAGLRPGDSILEVNGTPFTGISHEEALKMLKSCRNLSMTVRSPHLAAGRGGGGGGAPWQMRQTCSWMDRHGRPVSPPSDYGRGGGGPPPTAPRYPPYGRPPSKDRSVRRVDLCIEPGQSLGLMIRGGVEYNLGIFITGVDKDSVADRAGLMVGDQILEVNGQSFGDVTHDEAVAQLKYHKRMSVVVRDVGKVPHSCTAYDGGGDHRDLRSPGSRAAATTRKWAAALQMVEEKARVLLARPQFTALCYYTDEYAARHMTVDAFVQITTELLNSPDKYTLMTELREIVAVEDRAKFDELVYRRDLDSRISDPREHDYGHSRRKGVPVPDSNHAIYSGYEEYGSGDDDEEEEEEEEEEEGGRRRRRHQPPPGGGRRGRRHSSPGASRSGSTTALHERDFHPEDSSGYLGGLRSSLGGWTQKVKSWYWGAPLELAHKLSRSFDMKDDEEAEEGERRPPGAAEGEGAPRRPPRAARPLQDEEGNLRITVKKTKPILGIAIEGGANTKHPLPRIININENGAAYSAAGAGCLEVGQLILRVDGTRVDGLEHRDVARLIAERFARRDRDAIEFVVVEPKRSNTEPKPTALVFLEA